MRETVCEIDRDILKLVLRRHNLLQRMAAPKGHLAPQEERYLRESWESQVAKVSSDPKLSSRFFTLLQEVEFLPRPDEAAQPKRPSFGLAPLQKPVRVRMDAPKGQEQTQLWSGLAASGGQAMHLTRVLMNDAVVDCVRMVNQFNCSLHRDADVLSAEAGMPAQAPDKIIHVGGSMLNFYMSVAHYIGRPSHAKFTGGPALKLADFSALKRFLPSVGARLISLVPRSDGLPVRIESAGFVPETVAVAADLPADFVLCLIMAAPHYQAPVRLDFRDYPEAEKEDVLSRALPLLDLAGIGHEMDGTVLVVRHCAAPLPADPALGMDVSIAAVILALAAVNGGSVNLDGRWVDNPRTAAVNNLFGQLGLALVKNDDGISVSVPEGYALPDSRLVMPAGLPCDLAPLPCALACVQALRHGRALVPDGAEKTAGLLDDLASFAGACGLILEEGVLQPRHDDGEEHGTPPWTAPSSMWACALALAACARPHAGRGFQLNNPGVLTELYPAFWTLYNTLPEPSMRRAEEAPAAQPAKGRRRIRTTQVAQLPPMPDEDL